ncbi:hypothetical protein Golob_023383 [Gossypium lobatum]|uniref:Thioesterase domain-containing protein n=1 Tax=Gossypium lobatum TaxID=34289 RepID=A0A7J8LJF7_9ROSI|nr:hypothetical protein [Gossypium lobatum]
MEKVKELLQLDKEAEETVSRLTIHPHRVGYERSFYNDFGLRGIRVDKVEPGFVSCTFKVPPRLTDKNGNLATGAIANIVDEVGGSAVFVIGVPMKVSVDISISFLGTAKLGKVIQLCYLFLDFCGLSLLANLMMNLSPIDFFTIRLGNNRKDELEITSKALGERGGYAGTLVHIRNKATGELIAEGRHSLYGNESSKLLFGNQSSKL